MKKVLVLVIGIIMLLTGCEDNITETEAPVINYQQVDFNTIDCLIFVGLLYGIVTFIPDDIDWEDEVRIAIEERASYSTDALTGMEASLRFPGPETLETKIFGRLSAWQNWIFQRPNAVGEEGALNLYGTGKQANYDRKRV